MNSNIIPVGPSEIITGPATISKESLLVTSLDDAALTAVVFVDTPKTANPAAVTAITLKTGCWLPRVESFQVITGSVCVVYSATAKLAGSLPN